MNLWNALTAVTLIGLFMIVPSGTLHATPQKAIVLTTHNLCPYGCFTNKSSFITPPTPTPLNFKGVAVDVTRCVLTKMNRSLKVLVLPWARAQYMVKHKQADGFFAASKNSSRDQYATISATIAEQKWQWYLLKENPLSPEQTSFKEKAMVGGFLGANMLKWMENEGYQVIARTKNTESLLKLLIKGRVNAVLANNYVMQSLLEKHKVTTRVKTYLNKDKPLGVYFSNTFLNDNPEFLKRFNNHVPSCRNSAVFDIN